MGLSLNEVLIKLEEHMGSNPRRSYGTPQAGVLVPLFEKEGEAYVLLTERSSKLRKHSGQISFPGGTVEEVDSNIIDTATRETQEEVGIDPEMINLIGKFHDFQTPYYQAVTPIIGIIPYPTKFVIEEAEIERILEVPIKELMDPEIYHSEIWEHEGNKYHIHFYDWTDLGGNSFNIWGATAGVLFEILEVLNGELVI